jgi:hypothetical protein
MRTISEMPSSGTLSWVGVLEKPPSAWTTTWLPAWRWSAEITPGEESGAGPMRSGSAQPPITSGATRSERMETRFTGHLLRVG